MALRKVVVEGDEVLRKKSREVKEVTPRIQTMLDDMVETMRNELGVGLAAPQIGVMRRMFVAEPEPDRVYYMINPVILTKEGSQTGDEGCLSVPGLVGTVERPEKITMKALDYNGEEHTFEFEGFDAVVMCHEYDHLDGILYIDKATNIREAMEAPIDMEDEQ